MSWRAALPRGKGWRLRYERRYRPRNYGIRRVPSIAARLVHVFTSPDRTRFVILRLYESKR